MENPGHSPSAPSRQSSNPGDLHRALILVVERDPNVRELEAYFLDEAGFSVEFAADGDAALEMARALRPDIVITEILVPKLDGLALTRTIRNDPSLRGTVVLIFSILAAQARASEAGADAFLMKPLAERRLVDTVRTLLAGRSDLAPARGSP
jgi:DNA-binding response OmpR family regulator